MVIKTIERTPAEPTTSAEADISALPKIMGEYTGHGSDKRRRLAWALTQPITGCRYFDSAETPGAVVVSIEIGRWSHWRGKLPGGVFHTVRAIIREKHAIVANQWAQLNG